MRIYLADMRRAHGFLQARVAKALNVSQCYYSDIENGHKQPDMSYSMMVKLASAFDVPVQTIIDAEQEYVASKQ